MKTIRHFFAATLLLASVTGMSAQSNYGEFRWGLKAGADFAGINNLSEGVEKDKGKTGFVGGAFCKIPLKFYLSIRPELLFNMKGGTLNIPTDVVGILNKARYSTNYIELPVSLDFDLPYFLDFHAGVQGSLLVSKNFEVDGNEIKDPQDFKDGEFGWHVGTGIDLGNIGVHVRFQQSLVSFYEAFLIGTGDIDLRNWGISLTAAYMFVN